MDFHTTINLPLEMVVLHVGYDHNHKLCIWIDTLDRDPDVDLFHVQSTFKVFPTGAVSEGDHVGTVITDIRGIVWHVYWISQEIIA